MAAETPERRSVAQYMREYAPVRLNVVVVDRRKWEGFQRLVRECKGKVEGVVIACPQVLGDTYEELLLNLMLLADAGLSLHIVGAGEFQRAAVPPGRSADPESP
jgi:hypothetical protein